MNSILSNIEKLSRLRNSNFYFARFNSWQEFMSKGNEYFAEMTEKYSNFRKYANDSMFDESNIPTSYFTSETRNIDDLNEGFYTTYSKNELLENVLLAFDEILADIDMGGSFKKSKLIITDRPQGIFDFGLASLGLFAEKEFYSEKLAKESPNEFTDEPKGVVPPIFVTKNQLGDFWYVSNSTGKKYKMTQQDKGTQEAIEKGYSPLNIPSKFKSFKTKQKRSYLLFKKEGGKSQTVDLYVPVGGLGGMEESGMLQRALPLFMAARFFESVGIRTRLNSARVYESNGNEMSSNRAKDGYSVITTVIKDFGEDLDFTKLAIAVADDRTYRYNTWKLTPAIFAKEYGVAQRGYGSTLYGGMKLEETTRRYKNWYYQQIKENDKQWLEVPKPLMIFGGVPNPLDTWDYNGNKNERGYKDIVEEFYRILDTVDLFYNDAKKACERIYERWVETNEKTISQYKTYIKDVLSKAFNVAEGGQYADSQESVDENIEEFTEKLKQVNIFLNDLN